MQSQTNLGRFPNEAVVCSQSLKAKYSEKIFSNSHKLPVLQTQPTKGFVFSKHHYENTTLPPLSEEAQWSDLQSIENKVIATGIPKPVHRTVDSFCPRQNLLPKNAAHLQVNLEA